MKKKGGKKNSRYARYPSERDAFSSHGVIVTHIPKFQGRKLEVMASAKLFVVHVPSSPCMMMYVICVEYLLRTSSQLAPAIRSAQARFACCAACTHGFLGQRITLKQTRI